jgi:hypothetical protein
MLERVAVVYAAVASYEDSGVVLIHDPRKDQPDEITFQTAFVRPDLLRFDWVRHHPYPPLRHIKTASSIWPSVSGTHFIALGDREPKELDLNMACAGATGVSRGSAVNIPRLLTRTLQGSRLVDLADVKLMGTEIFEGVACHRIDGRNARGTGYEVYVGETDHLIRRIITRIPGATPTEEIHRDIRINGGIPAAKLRERR